jgi:diketogulonate reductase-like aldo/keto reductase
MALEKLYKEGKCKAIGVSNYTESHLQDLLSYCEVKPMVNQVEFHPHLQQRSLLKLCKEHDIQLEAYSSLGSSVGKVTNHQIHLIVVVAGRPIDNINC